MAKIKIDPVNRMEGHLCIECQITGQGVAESGGYRVTRAELHGQLFRGFEMILKRRDPRDSYVLTQRI
jgi:Ni,Fe-hydrogenase I large subunit